MRGSWLLVALLGVGRAGRSVLEASTWLDSVETEDLVIGIDVGIEKAVRLAKEDQRLRTAIAENELPCAFERSNVPMEFVSLKDPRTSNTLRVATRPVFPCSHRAPILEAKLQLVMHGREAAKDTQLFVRRADPWRRRDRSPAGRPWLHQGMASVYQTARIDGVS